MQKEKMLFSVPKLILALQNNIGVLLKYNSEQDLCFTCKSIPSTAILSLSDVTYMCTLRLKNMTVISCFSSVLLQGWSLSGAV